MPVYLMSTTEEAARFAHLVDQKRGEVKQDPKYEKLGLYEQLTQLCGHLVVGHNLSPEQYAGVAAELAAVALECAHKYGKLPEYNICPECSVAVFGPEGAYCPACEEAQ